MSNFYLIYNNCAYLQPTKHTPNPTTHVRKLLIYGQIKLENEIYYSLVISMKWALFASGLLLYTKQITVDATCSIEGTGYS